MAFYLLHEPATQEQMRAMLHDHGSLVKFVVDIRRELLAAGGEMRYDGEHCCWKMAAHKMICGAPIGIRKIRASNMNRSSISVRTWDNSRW